MAGLDAGIPMSSTAILHSARYGARRVMSYRASGPSASLSSGATKFFCEPAYVDDEPRHPLDACFLCKKSLNIDQKDIFMYRGDTPFCSEECRQEQIDVDHETEKRKSKLSSTTNKQRQQ